MKKVFLIIVFLFFINNVSNANDWSFDSDLKGLVQYSHPITIKIDWNGEIHFKKNLLELTAGYKQLRWGKGNTASLIFSNSSPAIPYLDYQMEWWKFKYTRFSAPLESSRWLFGQRIDLANYDDFQFGVYELMLCSEEIFYGYYIPVPLVPYYAIQHLAYKLLEIKYDYNSNVMIGFDFQYDFDEQKSIYGEILIDDFPQSEESITPKKVAGLLGVRWDQFWNQCALWVEYVRINNFVYTHKNDSSRYLFKGQPLGHWMGMDGDLWAIGLNQTYTEETELIWQLHYIRKGEGSYTDNWKKEFLDEYSFLTGVVETSYEVQIDVTHQFIDQLQGKLSSVIGYANNASHIENVDEPYWRSMFTIIYDLF